MTDLKHEVAQSIAERIQPAEEKLANLDNNVSGLNKTIAIFEDRHVETVERIKEANNITNNIQIQIKEQEQKMVNQSTNDMNQIKEKLEDIENHAGLSDQKIKELDSGNQNLLNKILGMENEVADRLDDLAKTDASLLAKISSMESTNGQTLIELSTGLEKKIGDSEGRLQESTKADIQSLADNLGDQIKTNITITEKKLADAESGSKQLNEKLVQIEKEIEGRLTDNTTSIENQLRNLDADNKNNTQLIVSLQESVNLQSEEVKKVDAERQFTAAKAKEDLDATVAANARAIDDLKNAMDESISQKIQPTEEKLRQVDGEIQVINKTVAIFESKHVETIEKLKEVTVLSTNIQSQVQAQEQKMIEQSANELNQIMEQLNDIKEEAGVTGQKMNNLDAGNKNLLEKIIGVEADLNDKLNKQAEMDDNLMNRINDIQHNNNK